LRPGCTDLCFLADGKAANLRKWKVNGSSLDALDAITVDPTIALPPRTIGAF